MIYIYSNSNRNSNIKFKNYKPDENSYHVFLNDAYALFTNLELFKNIKHKILINAFDNWHYINHWRLIFNYKLEFEKIYVCNHVQYCKVDPQSYSFISVDGKISNKVNNKNINTTTGLRSIRICEKEFPNEKITLVNFNDKRNKNYDSITDESHNWNIEIEFFKQYKIIYV